ncbi:hypothetical protein MKZ26_06130 [Sporosarcina sp. FSL K6-6792]|uniref:hypothetical protein n=1 Tax=Sporosarcina sp. FSL K6-6792 TaxID=2921559 RepID=UPI0030F54724
MAKGDISRFPLSSNGHEVYDVVYVGEIIPQYMSNDISNILLNEYVFVFSTMLRGCKGSSFYGHVEIDFMRHELISSFNGRIRERGSFHVLDKENLNINEFLEIVQEDTEYGKQIIANLRSQSISDSDGNVTYIRDFRVSLVKENNHNGFANLPKLELGPEFEAKLKWDLARKHLDYLDTGSSVLLGLVNLNHSESEHSESINKVREIVEQEEELAKVEHKRAFNNYLSIRSNLMYICKGTEGL